jgi:DNA invertase Pin-like site-specific DNA recombinase
MATNDNSRRLRAIIEGFSIPIAAVAEAAGISRAYVSRVLSENDDLTGNDQFWLKVEKSLGKLIEARRAQVFQLGAVEVEKLDALRKAS